MSRAAVVAEALSWLNTPYHPHARLKGAGVDCAMLPAEVYEAAGLIPHVEPEHYPVDWHLHRDEERYLSVVLAHARETTYVQPGDLVLYKWGRCFAHGGIVIQWPTIVHAFIGQGVVEANGTAGRLADREHKFYTLWDD
jgi:cell wall-associated NlpC family hydrolase